MFNTYYEWRPIQPLHDADRAVDLSDVDALRAAWESEQEELKKSDSEALNAFNEELLRLWSIETGIIERLYDLDRGTTQTLVEQGFVADLIDRSSTDIEKPHLLAILNDQRDAARFVVDTVSQGRALNNGTIRELHDLLTRHQPTTQGLDSAGYLVDVSLMRGQWKQLPNNPTRPDGMSHQYCPPVQVQSEMDCLLNYLEQYQGEHPILVAAWLHHRFAQIHPFQDGNGRVSRCLVTFVLLRGRFLPIVVSRDERSLYLEALEEADHGSLSRLVQLFADLEKKVLLQAVSIAGRQKVARDYELRLVNDVAQNIAARLAQRRSRRRDQLLLVNDAALDLLHQAKSGLEEMLTGAMNLLNAQDEVAITLRPAHPGDEGGPQAQGHWYRHQIIRTARESGHWANFNEAHYWARRTISSAQSRLLFVVSLHHVGHELTGVMEATCFAEIIHGSSDAEQEPEAERDFIPCTQSSFTLTWRDQPHQLHARFHRWLNECLAIAIDHWGATL